MTRPGPRRSGPPDAPDLFDAPDAPPRPRPPARGREPAPNAYRGASIESAFSVTELTRAAKDIVEGAFPPLWVRGEVANFTQNRSGHWYFSLRDATARMRCVMWATDTRRVPAPPDDGMQVSAYGRMSVYAPQGEMQLMVTSLEASGDGLWRKALEQSIKRLTAEGLLDPRRKRRVTPHPRRIAVVTSPDGAALHDIISVVRRRCPIVEIVVVPASVQGDGAARELVAAIRRVGRWRDVDTVIVGRGGGSREDLWAFNDERVARTLAACPIPTISAVGHEIDTSLCDLVADLRAATPSAAAEAAVPVLADVRALVARRTAELRVSLERRAMRARRHFAETARDMRGALERLTVRRRSRLEVAAGRLDALSPLATLGRGYALATDERGHALTNAAQFERGRAFRLRLRDGRVDARTERSTVDAPAPPVPER
ncbi:MAG TPA: exodeoxyribonuclease VII large subunit [Gemmatimonadaceae bacterium]|nr:exodeoxyribonuclease VII large subunit [Gemmatimonadaceae bacterium]